MIRVVNEIDLPRVQAFLKKHIATSLFLLSNLAELGCRLTEHLNSGNFKYVEENKEICAVFCLTRRGNMLAQTGGRADIAQSILSSSENEPESIRGVVAEWTIAEAIWKLLCENLRFHPTYTSKETLFSLQISSANTQKFDTRQVRALEPPDFDDWAKINSAYLVEEGLPVQGTPTERHAGFVKQTQQGIGGARS